MQSEPPALAIPAALNQAEAIDALLARLEEAARQDRSPADFYEQLVHSVVSALSALSGAAWVESDQGLVSPHRLGSGGGEGLDPDLERRLAAAALTSSAACLLDPGAAVPDSQIRNESQAVQCFVPRRAAGVPGVVLRVALPAQASLNLRETASGLLTAAAEIALGFQSHHRLRQLDRRDAFWQDLESALLAIHSASSLKGCAAAIAEQCRRLLPADRVSLLIRRGRHARFAAISSAAATERRSRQVRLLEQMAGDVLRNGQGFEVHVGAGVNPLRVSEHVDAYLEETQLRAVRGELLRVPESEAEGTLPVGVLIADNFSDAQTQAWSERLALLTPHLAQAVSQAQARDALGWRRWLVPFQSLSRTALWAGGLALLAAAVTALVVIPADLTIEARGRLMPAHRRGAFAPTDAIVEEILVSDGAPVRQGQPLVRLTDPELDLEASRIQGELQTALARLDGVQARRKLKLQDRSIDVSLLSIEEAELKATVEGLRQQLDVVKAQQARLVVSSPLSGRVARWDLEQVLQSLPVRHGQNLIDVYDPDGPWRLELDVPDDVSGYVRAAAVAGAPRVDFVFETDPSHIRSARLNELGDATDLNADQKLTVRGLVELPEGLVSAPRRGASVTAKIYCGRRALGFVWFRELVEFVQRQILF